MSQTPKTFGLVEPYEMLLKLEYELPLCHPSSDRDPMVYATINFATTAWHLPEWLGRTIATMSNKRQQEIRTALGGIEVNDPDKLRGWAVEQCPAMEYCRQIATWSKHLECRKESGVDIDTEVSASAVDTIETRDGESLTLQPERTVWVLKIVEGDKRIRVADAFDGVYQFWLDVFHKRSRGEWQFGAKTVLEREAEAQ